MGNTNNNNSGNYDGYFFKKQKKYSDHYTDLDNEKLQDIKNNYKILEVNYLDPILVRSKMFGQDYFELSPHKKESVNQMLDFYMNHPDHEIYKKTNYLCDEKEKICICNIHANDLRKIYDGINHDPKVKFISWFTPL